MLRISRIADYGVVLGTRLAALPGTELRSTVELAADTGIPQPTVSKILKQLVRDGIVGSERGARGGYRLAHRPEDVSVAAIISALEGPIGVTECGVDGAHEDHTDCELSGHCDVRGNWQLINQAILRALEGITLAEMAAPGAEVLVTLGKKGADSPKLHVNER
jgi:FeS assembly SUF system regulator